MADAEAKAAAEAAMMAKFTVYNMPAAPPTWDRIGVFFIAFCATWTTIVFAGMAFVWFNRHNPVIRVRGVPLSFLAIILLHCYWILAQLVYPIGKTMNTVVAYDVQYFAMGIYFPLGIALFHASNLRFLHVAKLQKQFAYPELKGKGGCNGKDSSWLCRLRNLNYTVKIMLFIGVGMVFQIILTVGMWLACAKYHPTYGIPGTGIKGATFPEQVIDLGRGWEWWPSVVWQFIWTWMVAPFLLWRAWGIRDTMGWRTQTIGVCLSNLHATPMFLIASYAPAFNKVNMYYPPSQWIHLSVMCFEIFTIFIPVAQIIRQKIITKKAIESNNKWEAASQTTTLRTSSSVDWKKCVSPSLVEKGASYEFMEESMGDRLHTMAALEHVLHENPAPLQDFSALSDFSGENIAFLTRVAAWQASNIEKQSPGEEDVIDMYNKALDIYTDFISVKDAEFPLNISSKSLKTLQAVFERAARILNGEGSMSSATPFDSDESLVGSRGRKSSNDSSLKVRYTGTIPEGFGPEIYDEVQKHIKYLVLTNTWPKFVEEMANRRRSLDSEHSDFSANSGQTLASKVSSTISNQLSKMFPNMFNSA